MELTQRFISIDGKRFTIQWCEVIHCHNGMYSVANYEARDGLVSPAVEDSYQDVLKDHIEMIETYSERDEEWGGEIFPCYVDGEKLYLLDPEKEYSVIDSFSWRN